MVWCCESAGYWLSILQSALFWSCSWLVWAGRCRWSLPLIAESKSVPIFRPNNLDQFSTPLSTNSFSWCDWRSSGLPDRPANGVPSHQSIDFVAPQLARRISSYPQEAANAVTNDRWCFDLDVRVDLIAIEEAATAMVMHLVGGKS